MPNDASADAKIDLDRTDNQSIVAYRARESKKNNAVTESGELPNAASASTKAAQPGAASGIFSRIASRFKPRSTHTLSDKHAPGSIVMLCAIVGLSALGGFLVGKDTSTEQPIVILQAGAANDQPSTPVTLSDAQRTGTDAELTRQIGQLRAELLRLHTVFVHLADLAELDEGEFDLQSPLLDWQEQSSFGRLGLLNRRLAHMSASSEIMMSIFDTRRIAYDQKISGKPVVEGHRTSGFGYRVDPINGGRVEHLGLDYSGPVGEPILALADGIVAFSGKNSGYGNLVELEHVDGFRTRYAHNHTNLVSRGARVKKGEPIATLGSTGRSTGPHVHVEVRLDGQPIDPGFFLQ